MTGRFFATLCIATLVALASLSGPSAQAGELALLNDAGREALVHVRETPLYAAAIAISGPVNVAASRGPKAQGRRVLAIHGADDRNVPIGGGVGTTGLSRTAFRSEESARRVLEDSGGTYTLQIVPGADHAVDHIDAEIQKIEGVTIA